MTGIRSNSGSTPVDRLKSLFNPKSIALFGATDKSRWSLYTYNNLRSFSGEVHCINPKATTVHGQQAYADIADVPGPVDLAYLMVPTRVVHETLERAADAGVRNAVILTAGFAEVDEEGRQLQQQIVDLAHERDLTLLGPNGNGYLNFAAGILPYGLPVLSPPPLGGVGVALQSGALASAILTLADARSIGLSMMVSMGNEAMVTLTDVVDYLIEDEGTTSIALFIESIRSPDEFVWVAEKARRAGKPIVAMKVGRSEASAMSALAHTGSLVGEDRVVDAVFRQLDVIRAESLEDLIMTAGLLAQTGPLAGSRAIFVTPSGGACDIIADRCESEGIALPTLDPIVAAKLADIVPAYAHVQNPLDVTGYVVVDPTLLPTALGVASADPRADLIVCMNEPPRVEPPRPEIAEQTARLLAESANASPVPVLFMTNSHIDLTPYGRAFCDRVGLRPPLGGIEHGLSAVGHAMRWSVSRSQERPKPEVPDRTPIVVPPGATGVWGEHQAAEFLAANAVPMTPHRIVESAVGAAAAAEELGFPVAAKMAANDLAHKSDVGGVLLALADSDAVANAYNELVMAARKQGIAEADEVLIAPMRSGGLELIVGVVRDPQWGQMLAVGLGGVWVEALKDTALRRLPVTTGDVHAMLGELRGSTLLDGFRGTPAVDRDRLVEVVCQIAAVAYDLRDHASELEVNPLWVQGDQIEGLDALIHWAAPICG